MQQPDRFFLFIGDTDTDAAVSRLKAARVLYRKKQLQSRPENWRKIIQLLREPGLRRVIGTMNAWTYRQLCQEQYREVGLALLATLAETPHVVFVHEQVLTGEEVPIEPPLVPTRWSRWAEEPFANEFPSPDPEERVQVNGLLEQYEINILPYRTNAERSMLAASFVEDHERDLLLRVYVPHGRLYADETDRLLGLFRNWLGQVRQSTVRQDGYTTAVGRVYEFVGDGSLTPGQLRTDMETFQGFLDVCVDSPEIAERQLVGEGVEAVVASRLVSKYAKEKRRLDVDMRHARDSRVVDLRRALESELIDADDAATAAPLPALLDRLVSALDGHRPLGVGAAGAAVGPAEPLASFSVTINNPQIIGNVEGTVVGSLTGTAHFGPQAQELLELINRHGGVQQATLVTALHEVEDDNARRGDRMRARQALKAFLIRVGGHGEKVSVALLQKYLESKIGGG
jgi:hypothetical protein